MVRVGGGWEKLRDYIAKHKDEENEKMLRKIDKEEETKNPMSFRRMTSKGNPKKNKDKNEANITIYEYFRTLWKYRNDLTENEIKRLNDEWKSITNAVEQTGPQGKVNRQTED